MKNEIDFIIDFAKLYEHDINDALGKKTSLDERIEVLNKFGKLINLIWCAAGHEVDQTDLALIMDRFKPINKFTQMMLHFGIATSFNKITNENMSDAYDELEQISINRLADYEDENSEVKDFPS